MRNVIYIILALISIIIISGCEQTSQPQGTIYEDEPVIDTQSCINYDNITLSAYGNPEICKSFEKMECREACIKDAAVASKQERHCEILTTKDAQSRCFESVAMTKGRDVCRYITQTYKYGKPLYECVGLNGSVQGVTHGGFICIEGATWEQLCELEYAVSRDDPIRCQALGLSRFRDVCALTYARFYVNDTRGQSDTCEMLSNANAKSLCSLAKQQQTGFVRMTSEINFEESCGDEFCGRSESAELCPQDCR
jgi:hypothetical protein